MRNQALHRKISTAIRWRVFNPKTPRITKPTTDLIRLGSRYGGKFVDSSNLDKNSFFVSGGAGEDISFELELQKQIGLNTYIIDPTPEAIKHFKKVSERGPKNREVDYSDSSRQDPRSYDTSELEFSKVSFIQEALWNRTKKIKFYKPNDGTRDSSHSISGIHNNYRKNGQRIIVQATTIPEFLLRNGISHIDLLKLDIEGAAMEVLESTFLASIFPKQILLEVDELHFPGPKSWIRARKTFKLLNRYEYICINRDNCDFTFIRF
jgi:FkbM family methyltransferase